MNINDKIKELEERQAYLSKSIAEIKAQSLAEKEEKKLPAKFIKCVRWKSPYGDPTYIEGKIYQANEDGLYTDERGDKDEWEIINHGGWEIPTTSEIESHLIEEARKKGFVVGSKVKYKDSIEFTITSFELINDPIMGIVADAEYFCNNGIFLAVKSGSISLPLNDCELSPSTPTIEINGYKADFKEWGLDFNNGCDKIDKELFISLANVIRNDLGCGNKVVEKVTIGKGTFTDSEILDIASYYEKEGK